MRRTFGIAIVLALLAVPAGRAATPAPAATHGPKLEAVTFGIRHRVFHDFRDVQRVKLNQDFLLGDSEYSARVIQYLPDFQMDIEHHKFFSLSDQPRNPAFRVVVSRGKAPHDTSWAFLKSPPHFSAKSYFSFEVLRIDFVGHPPLLADTTTAAQPAGGMPPSTSSTRDSSRSH
jgi:hypothetical protein